MAEFRLRYNPSSEQVELLVDDKVAMESGAEEFKSWVLHWNYTHDFVKAEEPVEPKKVVVTAEETPVTPPAEVVPDTPVEVVDKTTETVTE